MPPTVVEVPISAKSLQPREQQRVREALKELATQYENQTELGRALHVGQQTVSKALKPEGTIGVKLAQSVARLRRQNLDELLGGAPAGRVYAQLKGWPEAAQEAIAHGEAPAAVAAISRWPASLALARVEWRFVADLAALWRRWAPADEREAEETDDAAAEAKALIGRAGEVKGEPTRRGRSSS